MNIQIDTRLYDLIRQDISSIQEALIELITNSIDAYNSIDNPIFSTENFSPDLYKTFPIEIETDIDNRIVRVRDHALGMSLQDMKDKLMVVGKLTAHEYARGIIGRGSKDITNLGDATFISIKNGKLAKITIKNNLEIIVNDEIDATENDYIKYKLDKTGVGLLVELEVLPNYIFYSSSALYNSLCLNYLIREYIQNSSHPILLDNKKLVYSPPDMEKILDLEFSVQGYTDVNARFIIHKMSKLAPIPNNYLEKQYGIIVKSNKSTYECGVLSNNNLSDDLNYIQDIRYIYGELICDYIDVLARDLTLKGKTDKNPFLVFSSGRRNGLNKNHPFTNALYDIPSKWLQIILSKLQDNNDDNLINNQDIQDLIDDVANHLECHLEHDDALYTWRSKTDQEYLDSMIGKVNNLYIDTKFINIEKQIIDNIIYNTNVVPQSRSLNKQKFKILLSNNPDMIRPYEFNFYSDQIIIKINANDESLVHFINIDENKVKIISQAGYVSFINILSNAIIDLKIRQFLIKNAGTLSVNTNHLNELRQIQNELKYNMSSYLHTLYSKFTIFSS